VTAERPAGSVDALPEVRQRYFDRLSTPVGEGLEAVGTVGQLAGLAATAVAPPAGLIILRGSKALADGGIALQLGANVADGVLNDKWGGLTEQAASLEGELGAFNGLQRARNFFGGNSKGQFAKGAINKNAAAQDQASQADGGYVGGETAKRLCGD
jgi:hypothetical protein